MKPQPTIPPERSFLRPKKQEGRPTNLTKEVCECISKYVRQGNYLETAAAICNVPKQTVYNWMLTKPDHKDTIESALRKKKFRESVLKAQAESEIDCLASIKKHSAKSWKATAWRLERRFPERYAKKSKVDLGTSALDKLVETIKESKKNLKKDS